MTNTAALEKVLHVREMEKSNAQKAYRESIENFEEIAYKLYLLLKKKEDAEELYDSFMQQSLPIEKIKEQMRYIEQLNKEIMMIQQSVQEARAQMEEKQENLTNAHVETKKFEKIINHRKQQQAETLHKNENAFMDEISIQQFMKWKNR